MHMLVIVYCDEVQRGPQEQSYVGRITPCHWSLLN